MSRRYGVYYTPPRGSDLAQTAAGWLGRDAWSGEVRDHPACAMLSPARLADLTQSPRLYGFHGTLKAPFRLAEGASRDGLCTTLQQIADTHAPVQITRLDLRWIGSFLALVCGAPCPELGDLAGDIVRAADPFRAPLTDAEITKRRPETLTPRERAYLATWGYPYVFDAFRFHMTLTGAVPDAERAPVFEAAQGVFAPFLSKPLAVDRLALFTQPSAGASFVVERDWPLTGPHGS